MYEESLKRPPQRVIDVGAAYGTLLAYCAELLRDSGKLDKSSDGDFLAWDFVERYFPVGNKSFYGSLMRWEKLNVQLADLSVYTKRSFDWIIMTECVVHFLFYPSLYLSLSFVPVYHILLFKEKICLVKVVWGEVPSPTVCMS